MGEIGRFRRRHLVPVPKVATLADLNELIAPADVLDDSRVITGRPVTVGVAFTAERTAWGCPLSRSTRPGYCTPRVDNRARISARQNLYSVPARYVSRRLEVRLTARTIEAFDGPSRVAVHERAFGRYGEVLILDHYLEVLAIKPGGLPGATALNQAKVCGAFTPAHQRYWDATRRARGDAQGTRNLVEILLAHRTLPTPVLVAAMERAVTSECLDPQTVLIDARREQAGHVAPAIAIGALARYDRPAPSLTEYDQLLTTQPITRSAR